MNEDEKRPTCQHCGKTLYRGFGDKCTHCLSDPSTKHGKDCDCPKDKK